uniref:ABC transporter domain-containing protein n=1 Tax=Chromera velia CCMP2878 TaxID=1169474 RepID=A0A0G4FZV8_9ALVE|eukprot:Cvel_511.t1-p1 / transcript=Cvel_511.t1 / gene=Cvel_511 / organism=Chromera_velia_CCMP2878 / gene_product=Uncharacterized ABC transporter ATP-binding protein, putative / transcript_product=Uncharacterized ABC transporter ATP-binding protein, putative / location=Cvel_scaffold16:30281-32030(-) / protein_length=285 / sequence_SO=supercontig / SO=protein_coding / is_pseudo=false
MIGGKGQPSAKFPLSSEKAAQETEPSPSYPFFEVKDFERSVGSGQNRRLLWTGVSLQLQEGDCCLVVGPSGVGKSTFLKTLAILEPRSKGTVSLRGVPAEKTKGGVPVWRRDVCYVAQEAPVFPGTPLDLWTETLKLKSRVKRDRESVPVSGAVSPSPAPSADIRIAQEIAASWGLREDAFSEPWQTLSGGERQRAALAICVALGPSVLLLDEPTASLDLKAQLAVEKTVKERRLTCVWVTHDKAQKERLRAQRALDLCNFSSHQTALLTAAAAAGESGVGASSV